MIRDQLTSPRFNIAFALSLVCFTISACADNKPAVEASTNKRAEYEATVERTPQVSRSRRRIRSIQTRPAVRRRRGCTPNYGQAKEWFEKAAKQGHAGAQANLGTLYLQGRGAPQSSQMALFWFSRAAEQGNALAFTKLGSMYAEGRGVLQDFTQAHMWYNLAAVQGEPRAAEARDALTKQMTPAQIAEAQRLAREWKPKGQ